MAQNVARHLNIADALPALAPAPQQSAMHACEPGSWQENWLFRRGPVGKGVFESPVAMFVPNPTSPTSRRTRASVGGVDVEDLSELSERPSSEASSPWSEQDEDDQLFSPGPMASIESSGQRDLEHTEYAVAAATLVDDERPSVFIEEPSDSALDEAGPPLALKCQVTGERPIDVAGFQEDTPIMAALGECNVSSSSSGDSLLNFPEEDSDCFDRATVDQNGKMRQKTFSVLVQRE